MPSRARLVSSLCALAALVGVAGESRGDPPSEPQPGERVGRATLTPSQVRAALQAQQARVDACEADADVEGALQIRVTVEVSGRVALVEALSAEFEGSAVAACVVDAMRGLSFEPFEGRTAVFELAFTIQRPDAAELQGAEPEDPAGAAVPSPEAAGDAPRGE